MSHYRDPGFVERSLSRLEKALLVAKRDSLQKKLSQQGYDLTHIEEGITLCDLLRKDLRRMRAEFGEEIAEKTKLERHTRNARAAYTVTRKIAEIAFDDMPAAHVALHFNKEYQSWQNEAFDFYQALLKNEAFIDRMNSFGFRKVRLKDESERVEMITQQSCEYPLLRPSFEVEQEIEIFYGWMEQFISVIQKEDIDDPVFLELLREKESLLV